MGAPHVHVHGGHSQNDRRDACIAARSQSRKPSPKRNPLTPHGWATFIKQPASQRANLGDALCNFPRKPQTILFNGSARTALKMVGSDQCGHIESCPIEPAGKQWKRGMVTDGETAIQ